MKNRIYIKEWALMKPYSSTSTTDIYYLGIANRINRALRSDYDFILNMYLSDKEVKLLSCFLASYFEDIISETNIWNTFIKNHLELYGSRIPFFTETDYYEEEINLQDVRILIWYFLNTIQRDLLVYPQNDFILEIANDVMAILEDEYEYAPENDLLKKFYTLDEKETDYYKIRSFIDNILFKTYLFYPDTGVVLLEQESELIEESDENLIMYLREMRDNLVHKAHTSLLGFKGKEWAAKILGEDHPLTNDFLSMSQRLSGFFLYKGQNENYVFFEHIASGRKFELLKTSFDSHTELTEIDTIVYLGMVRWKSDWWFSGISFSKKFDADLVMDERNSIESRMKVDFLEENIELVNEVLKKQQEAFLKINHGSPIAFLRSDEVDDFIKNYNSQYERSINLTETEKDKAKERANKEGFFGWDDKDNSEHFLEENFEVTTCFFNPKSGLEFAIGVSSAFPVDNNPFFETSESKDDIMEVLISTGISTELAKFCVDLGKEKLPFFKDGIGAVLLEDIDFLLRFWKKEGYFSSPAISFTGTQQE